MLVPFLVIMLLQLSWLSWTLSLGFCIFTPSECPGVMEIVLLLWLWFHFQVPSNLERITWPSKGIPSCMIVLESWDLAVLLRDTARCILLNVRLNNDRPQLPAVVVLKEPWSSAVAILSEFLSILPLITHQSDHLCSSDVCAQISASLSALSHSSLELFAYSSPLFTKCDVHSIPHSLNIPLPVLSISLPTCSASKWVTGSLLEELHSFWKLAITIDKLGQGINDFTSFHQPLLTGYSWTITLRRAVGCIWRRTWRSKQTAGSRR